MGSKKLPTRIVVSGEVYILARGDSTAKKLGPNKCPEGYKWDGESCQPDIQMRKKNKSQIKQWDKDEAEITERKKGKGGRKKLDNITPKTHPRHFTKGGRRLFRPINPQADKVIYNPDYDEKKDNTYYAKSVRWDEKKQRTITILHYSQDWVSGNNVGKFEHVKTLNEDIHKIRKGYKTDMQSNDPNKKYFGLALALADQGHFRVGNPKSEKDNKVLGLHNLKVKSIKLNGNKATVTYIGKDSIKQIHHLHLDARAIKLIKELMKGKDRNDYLLSWTDKMGKERRVKPETLNQYFKSKGAKVTVHKLRTHHATSKMYEAIQKPVPESAKRSESALSAYFKSLVIPISHDLGHTSISTTLKHYIDPELVKAFFKRNGFHVPKQFKSADLLVVAEVAENTTVIETVNTVDSDPDSPGTTPEEDAFHEWAENHEYEADGQQNS